jgi:hypothetical protein
MNGYVPGVTLEPEIQDDLWCDRVDGGIEDPSFNPERKSREEEVGTILEEDMRDNTVTSPFPL